MEFLETVRYRWVYFILLLCLSVLLIPYSHAADWRINTSPARISFKTTGLMSIQGEFPKFESIVQGDLFSPEKLQIDVKIQADQVTTGARVSDEILKGSSFFNVKKYPFVKFKSSSIRLLSPQNSLVQGNLTLAGITKPIEFKVNIAKPRIDQATQITTVNTSAEIQIDRKSWGMKGFDGFVDSVVIIRIDVPFITTSKNESNVAQ